MCGGLYVVCVCVMAQLLLRPDGLQQEACDYFSVLGSTVADMKGDMLQLGVVCVV